MSAVLFTAVVSGIALLEMLVAVTRTIAFFAATSDCTCAQDSLNCGMACTLLRSLAGRYALDQLQMGMQQLPRLH